MVSPRRFIVTENRRGELQGIAPNPFNAKNQNLLKPPSVPLGDVRNVLAASRQLFNNVNENAKDVKGSDLKPLKHAVAPLPSTKEIYEPDPIWDAPLAWEANVEDTYHDIIPRHLQLNNDDWNRLVGKCSGPRTGEPLSLEIVEDVWDVSITSFHEDFLKDTVDLINSLKDDENLSEVPFTDWDSDDEAL